MKEELQKARERLLEQHEVVFLINPEMAEQIRKKIFEIEQTLEEIKDLVDTPKAG